MSKQPTQTPANDDLEIDYHPPQIHKVNDEYLDRFLTEVKKIMETRK